MNIAHILPHGAVFPLTKHNGRYEWALRLARLQAASGHNVTIFSGTPSWDDVAQIAWRTVPKASTKTETNTALFAEALADNSFDIFHSHFDSLHSIINNPSQKPIVCTQHWFPTDKIAQDAKQDMGHTITYVPVTQLMKKADTRMGIPCSDVIYHGIDTSLFHPRPTVSDRLIFVGRITPGKGAREAVAIAAKAGVPLDIYGKVNDDDRAYYESFAHLIDSEKIVYHGPKSLSEIAEAMSHAKALLFPSQVAEAFGQVTIEAQACGTPVIISNVGASHELVLHGVTGFVVQDSQDYAKAIEDIEKIDRTACRKHAEKFAITTMLEKYQTLYETLRK